MSETPPALESHGGCRLSGERRPRRRELRAAVGQGRDYGIAMQARMGRPRKMPQLTPEPVLAAWVVLCCVVIGYGSCALADLGIESRHQVWHFSVAP